MARSITLYEMLQVAEDAAGEALSRAYAQRLAELEAGTTATVVEEIEMQRRGLKMAYATLSDPMTRAAYDARLSQRAEEAARARRRAADRSRHDDDPDAPDMDGRRRLLGWGAGLLVLALVAPLAARLGTHDRAAREEKALSEGRVGRDDLPTAERAELDRLRLQAEERLDLQAFFHQHGVRVASRDEMALVRGKLQNDEREARRAKAQAEREARLRDQQARSDAARASWELDRQDRAERYREQRERDAFIRERELEEEIRRRAQWNR